MLCGRGEGATPAASSITCNRPCSVGGGGGEHGPEGKRESGQFTPALARRQSGRGCSWAGALGSCYNGFGMPLDKYWPEILVGLGAAGLGGRLVM